MQNKLPGFGLPVEYNPQTETRDTSKYLYPHGSSVSAAANEELALPLTTLRELQMMSFMNSITDTEDWHIKIHDSSQISSWKELIPPYGPTVFSDLMFEYCIDELKWKSRAISLPLSSASQGGILDSDTNTPNTPILPVKGRPPPVVVYDADVVKYDAALPDDLRDALITALDAYETETKPRSRQPPGHRNSNQNPGLHDTRNEIMFIDPSHYPLIFGRSRVLTIGNVGLDDCILRCGEGVEVPLIQTTGMEVPQGVSGGSVDTNPNPDQCIEYSSKYQWLPCEVDISGNEARITSYIPSIHPSNTTLYAHLSSLINNCIPLWETALNAVGTASPESQLHLKKPLRIPYHFVTYDNEPDSDDPDMPEQEQDEDEEEFMSRKREYVQERRVVGAPEPHSEGFVPPSVAPERLDFRAMYGATGLQVVVKATHAFTSPNDVYHVHPGGSWHVEGLLNEHIVATAIYAYSVKNITPPSISFRNQFKVEEIAMIDHDPDDTDHEWLTAVFGLSLLSDEPALQTRGGLETREGRLIAFPNILQSRFIGSELLDKTQQGDFKFITVCLVDPNVKVISTAHVPCQRRDWWWEEVLRVQGVDSRLSRLPSELLSIIFGYLSDFPISLEDAEGVKQAMDAERNMYTSRDDYSFRWDMHMLVCDH